jgi:hypothetical protein
MFEEKCIFSVSQDQINLLIPLVRILKIGLEHPSEIFKGYIECGPRQREVGRSYAQNN